MTNPDRPVDPGHRPVPEEEIGPLGLGHDPVKDPFKGLNGMVSGVLILEGISLLLALLVVLKVEGGALWTPFNWGFITVLGLIHFLLPAFVKKSWFFPVTLAIQVIGLVVGFFVHWSLAAMVLIYIGIWFFALHLRSNMIERMRRGLLTTQHLDGGGK